MNRSSPLWSRIHADGTEWEARIVSRGSETAGRPAGADQEILEFHPLDRLRPPRRLVVSAGALRGMDEAALRAAYRMARPIGGDHYGRPGKKMNDIV